MKVSVIVVNYRAEPYLDRCISCLVSQSLKPHMIILVDNSDEGKPAFDPREKWPDVVYLRQGKNTGFAAANNLGAKIAAESDWIALLNPDAFPDASWLENLVRAATQHPEYSFFGSRMLMANDPTRLDGTGDIYHASGLVGRRNHRLPEKNTDLTFREIFSPCAAAALYQREAFCEAGGFDEDYFCFIEDVDLGFRLRLLGYRCLYVPDAVVYHIGSAATGRHSDFSVYHGHRNMVWTFFKNMPLPLLLCYLPQHLVLNLFSIFWFALRGGGRTILRSKRDALRGLPSILKKRRSIQSRRKAKPATLWKNMEKGLPSRLK